MPTSPRREANHDAAVAGPTKEERAIADAQVKAAASALAVLERRLDKTVLRAPADGVVSVIVAEVGENIHAGQPVLVIEATGKRWLSFNAREDLLHGLTVGSKVDVATRRRARADAGDRHRAGAARVVRDLAGRAGDRRSRPQHAAPAPRSAGRSGQARARHDGLARSLRALSRIGTAGALDWWRRDATSEGGLVVNMSHQYPRYTDSEKASRNVGA